MKSLRTAGMLLCFVLASIPLLFAGVSPQSAPPAQPDAPAQITALLRDFLAAVPRSDPRVFDNFFANDVLYTRSAGVTIRKSDIMKSLGAPAPSEPPATYDADDITIHPYSDMAILNFRLIQRTENAGKTELAYFRNTATFLKRNNRWQVVSWQATRVPAEPAPNTRASPWASPIASEPPEAREISATVWPGGLRRFPSPRRSHARQPRRLSENPRRPQRGNPRLRPSRHQTLFRS